MPSNWSLSWPERVVATNIARFNGPIPKFLATIGFPIVFPTIQWNEIRYLKGLYSEAPINVENNSRVGFHRLLSYCKYVSHDDFYKSLETSSIPPVTKGKLLETYNRVEDNKNLGLNDIPIRYLRCEATTAEDFLKPRYYSTQLQFWGC